MAVIPAGIGIWWPSSVGTIPGGWDRDTDFDDRFPKGTAAGVDPGTQTGGGATHIHGSDDHHHRLSSHAHDYQTTDGTAGGDGGGGGTTVPLMAHYHTGTSGAVAGGDSGEYNSPWAAESSLPNNYVAIYIESDGTPTEFPSGCLLYYRNASAPTGWTNHVASREKFVVGASSGAGASSPADPSTHNHSPDGSHTHTADTSTHTHGNSESGPSSGGDTQKSSTSESYNVPGKDTHTINMTGSTSSATATATTGGDTGNYTNLPLYHTLLGITADAGDWLEDAIVMWTGTLSAAAALDDWQLCDGSDSTPDLRGRFIRMCASGGGDLNNRAGDTGHDHTNPSGHAHATSGTHDGGFLSTGSSGYASSYQIGTTGARSHSHYAPYADPGPHFASTEQVSPGFDADVQPVDTTADTQPPFKCVAYLQAPEEPVAGGFGFYGANF